MPACWKVKFAVDDREQYNKDIHMEQIFSFHYFYN